MAVWLLFLVPVNYPVLAQSRLPPVEGPARGAEPGRSPLSSSFHRSGYDHVIVEDRLRIAGLAELPPVVVSASRPQTEPVDYQRLLARLDQQEQMIQDLRQQLNRTPASGAPAQVAFHSRGPLTVSGGKSPTQLAPLFADADPGIDGKIAGLKERHVVTHYVGYENGFVVAPFNAGENPFELKLNGRIQFRHNGFAREVDTWTDNAGVTREVRNRNAFDIERARLLFSGTVIDPRMSFFLQLDGDSDGSHAVDFFDYWWGWRFNDKLQMQMGKRKVSASRQWLLGALDTMLIDRAMATDFFRPDRTVGVWLVGDLTDRMHYELMVGNGYRTTNLPLSQQNDRFGYALTHWIDLGEEEFGKTFADDEWHDRPVARLGHSLAAASQSDAVGGIPLDESDFVRLADGTVLDDPGALAPGTRVTEFDIYLYSVDAAVKYRGWSINGEYYFRWVEGIGGLGAIPITDLYDHGFYVQTSVYLIPETAYIAGRISQVRGLFGNHYEYAGGVFWYIDSQRHLKLSFDVTSLDGSPLNNTTSDILVGDDGLLFRTQFQARF